MDEIIELDGVGDSPQAVLLISLKNDDLDEFKGILERRQETDIDVDYLYEDAENKTLLDIACSRANKAPYVKYLLENGADVNLLNRRHEATPLHTAILHSDFDTVKLLVEHEDADIHRPNSAGKTAFHLAAQRGRTDFVKLLQIRQALNVERAKRKIRRQTDKCKVPKNIGDNLADESNRSESPKCCEGSLASLLCHRQYEAFASKARADNVNYVDENLGITYLQYACEFGLTKFVELLLSLKADPNKTTEVQKKTPMTIAAYHGYYDCVQLLHDTGLITYDLCEGENILNLIMKGLFYTKTAYGRSVLHCCDPDKRDYTKCLRLVLNNVPNSQLNVDSSDLAGNTPLYYAIALDNRDMILWLLERGASIGALCWNGQVLIKYIKPVTLEYFLDESMTTTTDYMHTRVLFNYNLLTFTQKCAKQEPINETRPLVALSEVPELRPLLRHPFFLVYLDFKWHIIMRTLFYANFLFFSQLLFSLSIYLITFDYLAPEEDRIRASQHATAFRNTVLINNCILLARELTQFVIYSNAKKYRYVTDPRNWMQAALITISYAILLGEIQSVENRVFLAATAIFFSHVELLLLILSHPRMSVHLEMFKATAVNSWKFLMPYLVLILGFAFSFHIIYRSTNPTDHSFQNITPAIFKTLVMSMGESDVSDVLITGQISISHLIVILFTFLVPIVLFNLLNANAVSDIQRIRKDAELVSTVARARLIAHMEDVISDWYSFLDAFLRYCSALAARPSTRRTPGYILEKQYYYTNHFSRTSYLRQIDYHAISGQCYIEKPRGSGSMKFVVLPTTQQSIRETLAAETRENENIESPSAAAKVTRETATMQEVCQHLGTLKNALEKIEGRLHIIEEKLTENTKL